MEIVETETFSRLKFSVSSRPRLFETANFQISRTETFPRLQFRVFRDRDSARVVETETFSRLSLISGYVRLSRSLAEIELRLSSVGDEIS